MTLAEVIRALAGAKQRGTYNTPMDMDDEVGIETADGWCSIKEVMVDAHGNLLIVPEYKLKEETDDES